MRHLLLRTVPALLLAAAPGWAAAQDSDADGVADASDAFPCDARVSAASYAPGAGAVGLLMFEDQFPNRGDFDFNDVTLTYAYEYLLDAQGRAVFVNLDLELHAVGGKFDNALGLTLPIPKGDVASVTKIVGGVSTALVLDPADANLNVTIIDDLRAFAGGAAGPIFNPTAAPVRVVVELAVPSVVPVSEAPHDLYISRLGQPGLQVHRTPYGGTASVDASLFNTGLDISQPGKWYVDSSLVPYVLDLPHDAYYPKEGVAISTLFPNITTWAGSGGVQARDFYVSSVDVASGHQVGIVGAPTVTVADTSCAAAPGSSSGLPGSSCGALLAAGQTADGVYWIDPDGSGGLPAYEAYCDQSTQGGGWILVLANRQQSAATVAIDTIVTPSLTQRALNDARWGYLRNNASEAMATFGSTQIVANMAALRSANCQPLSTTLTAPMLAHHENSGCSGTGTDYSLWFGYRNSWSRANAIYDHSGGNFYAGGSAYNPGTASMWVR